MNPVPLGHRLGLSNRPGTDSLTISAGRGGITLQGLHELWTYREVLYAFVARRIKVRYTQAVLGTGWVVIQPLCSAALIALFLGRIARFPSEGVPYFAFVLTGFILWSYFSQSVSEASDSVVRDAALIQKVYFPREIPPLAATIATLVDLSVGLALAVGASIIVGLPPSLSLLFLPLPILLVMLSSVAYGFLVSGLNVYYRDVRHALPFLLQIGLFASPVIYPTALIPDGARTAYEVFNPVTASIDSLRLVVLHAQRPDFAELGGALAWAVLVMVGTYAIFKRLERGFADVV